MSKFASFLTHLNFFRPFRSPKRNRKKQLRKDYKKLNNSRLFDREWYLAQNPDVAAARLDPIKHYLQYGWLEGRNPSDKFNGDAYLAANPDVKSAGQNPLVHYIDFGMAENRPLGRKGPVPAPAPKARVAPRTKDVFFSVVLTSCDAESCIREALEALARQTYQDFELIVADDGSQDGTVAIIREYADRYKKFRFIEHPEGARRGLAATLDSAIGQCRGEYIAFCEAHDCWTRDHLKQVNQLIRKTSALVVVNDVEPIGEDSRVKELQPIIARRRQYLMRNNGVVPPAAFREANYIVTLSCCCAHAQLLKSCNLSGCTHDQLAGWWIAQQICQNEKIGYLDKKLTQWRLHPALPAIHTEDEVDAVEGLDSFREALDKILGARAYTSSAQFNSKITDFDLFARLKNLKKSTALTQQLAQGDFCNVKVLYVTSTARVNRPIMDASSRYRCFHGAESISRRGGYAYVESAENFVAHPNYDYDVYIFHRPSTNALHVINELKGLNKILIADYDDLIIGHEHEAEQSSIYKNKIRPLDQTTRIFENNLKALLVFDYVSASTTNLAKAAQRFNPRAKVGIVHNFIPESIFRLAERLQQTGAPKNTHMMMYCSGTLSHNKDFPVAEEAILKALDTQPNLQFIVQGVLEAGAELMTRPRVYFHGPVDYWELFPIMSPAAFNLAPLEASPFNDCKSNVKFLEASLTGNLLIATPIEDMRRVADAHIFLPETEAEWEYYLTHLEELYTPQKAQENFQYVRKNCSEKTFVSEFRTLFGH